MVSHTLAALRDTRLVAAMALVIAFLVPSYAVHIKPFLLPLIVVMMIVSLKSVPFPRFDRDNFKEGFMLLIMSFGILSGLYILGAMFVSDHYVKIGLIIVGLMPPAISVIPLSFLLHADLNHALFGEVVSYIFALIFVPVAMIFFFAESINIFQMLQVLLLLLIFPLIVSRFIPKTNYDFKEVINVIIGIAIYLSVGLNVDRIISNPLLVLEILAVFAVIRLIFPLIIHHIGNKMKVPLRETALFTLFGTIKNGGLALGIIIALFPAEAMLPIAVSSILYPFQLMLLLFLFDGKHHLMRGLKKSAPSHKA